MHTKVTMSRQEAETFIADRLTLNGMSGDVAVIIEADEQPRRFTNKIAAIRILRDAVNRGPGVIERREGCREVSTTGFYIPLTDAKHLAERMLEAAESN